MRVRYTSNNSGGYWWLKDEDWQRLELMGWEVEWRKNETDPLFRGDKDGRFLGALATSATRHGKTMADAIEEWEQITGQSADEEGCPCCGQPHGFWEYEDNEGGP